MNKYTDLFDSIAIFMKTKGFVKKGATFYISRGNNWGLINFQKSNTNTAESVSFTINLSIYSIALRHVLGTINVIGKPNINDCHWLERIGRLMPLRKDQWWHIENDTDIESLINRIK